MVHVLAVRTAVGEALQTLETLERLLAGVESLMLRQVVLVLKSLEAYVALVRSLTCEQPWTG